MACEPTASSPRCWVWRWRPHCGGCTSTARTSGPSARAGHRGVDRTTWLGLYGFGYAFLPILGGIIVFAAGVKNAVVQSGEPLTASTAWLLAAGVGTYLVGLALFRRLLGIGPISARVAVAGAVLPSAMIGLAISQKHSWACWRSPWSAASWLSLPGSAT